MADVEGNILLQNLTMGNDLFILEPELTLPQISITVEIVRLEASLTLPQVTMETNIPLCNAVAGELALPNLTIEAENGAGVGVSGELPLQNISIQVAADIQHLVEGNLVLPDLSIVCETAQACTVAAELLLPDVLLDASAQLTIAETFETWVINSVTFAHANYTNYGFNSFIELNGTQYGLSTTGIHALTGATDNGTAISATAKWGVVNLGTDQKKIVDGGFLHCRMSEALTVGLTAEEGTRYSCTATDHGKAGIHAERFKAGKGFKGVLIQPDIANVAGADFDVTQLDLNAYKLQRRAG